VNYELVRSSEKNFRRQVPAHLATKGALDGDGLKREFVSTGRHIAAAPFTGNNEGFAA
jgi:hypothetical protein